jgi:hypothetical protein
MADAGLGRTLPQSQSEGHADRTPILGTDGSSAELLELPRAAKEGRSTSGCENSTGSDDQRLAE